MKQLSLIIEQNIFIDILQYAAHFWLPASSLPCITLNTAVKSFLSLPLTNVGFYITAQSQHQPLIISFSLFWAHTFS